MSRFSPHPHQPEPFKVCLLAQGRSELTAAALRSLDRHFAGSDIRTGERVGSLLRLVREENWFPDLVVVCQHWPDEFSQRDVRRLLELLPLTLWTCICGPWCESDGRNGSPWPTAVRVRAGCADLRIRRQRAVLSGEVSALPLTASRDEMFAFDYTSPPAESGNNRRAEVVTPDAEFRRTLHELLRAGGFVVENRLSADASAHVSPGNMAAPTESSTDRQVNAPAAIVWDVDPYSDGREAELRHFRTAHPSTAVVALMALWLPDVSQRVTHAGADVVLAKATIASELSAALKRALEG